MIQRLLPILGLVLLPLSAAAENASLVYDVNPAGPVDRQGGVRSVLYPLGNKALFAGSESEIGNELWATDGTSEGTEVIADLCPGSCWIESISFLGTTGGAAIFQTSHRVYDAYDEYSRWELWRSDGTSAGTYPLGPSYVIKGIRFGEVEATLFRNALYFSFCTEASGCELWRTDGTVAGTRRAADVSPGSSDSSPRSFFVSKDRLYFFANDGQGPALWRTDGTEKGTVAVQRLPGYASGYHFASAGARVFFSVHSQEGGADLWTSDGTAGGTRLLTAQPADLFGFRVLDGILYFFATDSDRGTELWRSDGTVQGTRPVTAFQDPSPFRTPQVEKAGSLLVFTASDGQAGLRLWTSGGTPETTRLLSGCPGGCPQVPEDVRFHRRGSRLLFAGTDSVHGTELWSTDGTGAGTRLVRDLCSGSCSSLPHGITPYLGVLYFYAENSDRLDLWKTDGTTAGTSHVAALTPRRLWEGAAYTIGGKLFLSVSDFVQGHQLWLSDGTSAGTAMLSLIGRDGLGSDPMELAALGDQVLFLACVDQERKVWRSGGTAATTAPLAGPSTVCRYSELLRLRVAGSVAYVVEHVLGSGLSRLWRTDGTDAGTFLLPIEAKSIQPPVFHGGRAVFTVWSDDIPSSLWETDGTAAGTRKLFEADLGTLIPLGPDLYVIAGPSLWKTDGTLAGTRKLMTSESGRYDPLRDLQLTRVGSLAYFLVDDAERRFWRTDGTAAGTYPVLSGSGPPYLPDDLIAFKGALYFTGKTSPSDKRRSLWKTDGTPGGTVRVADVGRSEQPTLYTPPAYMTVVGQQLFFVANDGGHGDELWRTDGTHAGTVLVRDIAPGSATSDPFWLTAAAGKLYFQAGDGEHGAELWESDGTKAGTRMVQDVAPGPSSSNPRWLTRAGNRLFFSANDGVFGREPWVLPLAGPVGCAPSDRVLCLAGGRFQAEIQWRDFQGKSGPGHAVSITPDTGYFWFFDAANVEVIVKALDGQGVNGHHWVFYGALSSVEYTLTITDTQTGAARRYVNPPGRLGSVGDTEAFGPKGATGALTVGPAATEWEPMMARSRSAALAPCVPSSTRLCLNQGRFAVEADWRDFQGKTGSAAAVPLTGDTGYFWFFDEKNVEVVLKVLDGRPLNGKFWLFYGALSSVEYTIRVTDTQTGQTRTYKNPSGRLASMADTSAF